MVGGLIIRNRTDRAAGRWLTVAGSSGMLAQCSEPIESAKQVALSRSMLTVPPPDMASALLHILAVSSTKRIWNPWNRLSCWLGRIV